ncbi:MAG: hypothetical protein FJ291_05520 [Planctomycetes bacterium]|nr:hypothetical protein [Planctomycetota bacterium]
MRMRDGLKRKAQQLAEREGVSLNNYINATVAASVAQEQALAFLEDRLRTMDLEALHRRVLALLRNTRPGREPSPAELDKAIHGR